MRSKCINQTEQNCEKKKQNKKEAKVNHTLYDIISTICSLTKPDYFYNLIIFFLV